MAHLLETGQLQAHIAQTLQPAYAARYHTLLKAIATHLLPLGFTLPRSDRDVAGGFFLWLGLPEGLAAGDFARVCAEAEEGVIVAPGAMFEVPGDSSVPFEGNVRLCFAWESEENLGEGVRRMRVAAERLLADGGRKGEGEYVFVDKRDVKSVEDFK
jgi:DNA-binding transcriptional MocR family regulator